MGKGAIIKKMYTGEGSKYKYERTQLNYTAYLYRSLEKHSMPVVFAQSTNFEFLMNRVKSILRSFNLNENNYILIKNFIEHTSSDVFALNLDTGEVIE